MLSPEERKRNKALAQKKWKDTHPDYKPVYNKELQKKHYDKYVSKHKEEIALAKKQYRILNKNKTKGWELKRYGITLDQYNKMLQDQNGGCKICNKPNPNGRALAVDHDHMTNKVRGLLCDNHNIMIGMATDSPEILRKAAEYLEK